MKRALILTVVFAIIGLVMGYLIYGRMAGEYVSLKTLFGGSGGALESFGRKLIGLNTMKQNILLCGAGGALLGFIIGILKIGKR